MAQLGCKLQEYLHNLMREPEDSIRLLEQQRANNAINMQAIEEKRKRYGTEIKFSRELERKTKNKIQNLENMLVQVNLEIDEIEQKRQELIEKRGSLEGEKTNANRQINEFIHKIESLQNEIEDCQRKSEEYLRIEDKIQRDLHRAKESAKKCRFNALTGYMEQMSKRLLGGLSSQMDRPAWQESLQKLKHDRNSDPEIGAFCDARDEIRRFLQNAQVPPVIQTLKEKLIAIEEHLDKRHPGALLAESSYSENILMEETYSFSTTEGQIIVLLPISKEILQSSGDKTRDQFSKLAFYNILFEFARIMGIYKEIYKIGNIGPYSLLIIDEEANKKLIAAPIQCKLPGSINISFRIMQLPLEIEEAVRSEEILKKCIIMPNDHLFYTFLRLAPLGAAFEDCWPQPKEAWAKILSSLGLDNIDHETYANDITPERPPHPKVSDPEKQLLEKLQRKRIWGRHVIGMDTIKRHLCPYIMNIDEVIENLVKEGLLLEGKRKNSFSLNPKEKKRILDIIECNY